MRAVCRNTRWRRNELDLHHNPRRRVSPEPSPYAWFGMLAVAIGVALWGWLRPGPVAVPSLQRVTLWQHTLAIGRSSFLD
ncbi:MAG: hypothetical protein ACRELE_08715 [Gemmatimonadales bacterium]